LSWPITLDDVVAARERLRGLLAPTPLRRHPALDEAVGARVLVKHEEANPTCSFKARNGLSVLSALPADVPGVVAATRGNHGLGVAWAGRELSIPVTICVPRGNSPLKNEAIRALGAQLVEEGRDYDESVQAMKRLVRERGLRMVHSTNDPLVIAGAGTLTLEIIEHELARDLDAIVVAVGGGSQAVGALTVVRALRPEVAVFGVQAANAPAIHDSWHAGRPLVRDTADTFADGLATRMTYELTFPALREGLADFVLVSEEEIADALRLLRDATGVTPEGAGAAGLAGLRKLGLAGRTVAIVLSGANIDPAVLAQLGLATS
jgi:threonine dehydratase